MKSITRVFFILIAGFGIGFIGCSNRTIIGDIDEFEIREKSEKFLNYSVNEIEDAQFEVSCEPSDLLKIDGLKISALKIGDGVLTVKEKNSKAKARKVFFTVLPYSKTITSVNGEKIIVPVEPQRVVTIAGTSDLVFLGIKPVAGMHFFNADEFTDVFDGVAELLETQPFDVEEIAKYNPDLIIYNKRMAPENIEKLKSIALVAPYDIEEVDVQKRLEGFCNIFGLDKKLVKTKIDEQENKITAIKKRLIDSGFNMDSTISHGSYVPPINGLMISGYTDFYINVVLFEKLGLTKQENFAEKLYVNYGMNQEKELPPKHVFMGPMEQAVEYVGDYFFLLGFYPEQLKDNAVFKTTLARKNNNVFVVDMILMIDKSPLYLEAQANILVDMLLNK